ncbi:MAG: Ku protein, partial [Humibacillus sp.]
MRAIWKGAVSFGLVNVPVRLFSATENHDVQFRQVHEKDGGRIRYKRVCAIDGEEVAFSDIAKGYEAADGQMVVLSDEDMKGLPSRSTKEIAIEKFVPSEQIDPLLFDKSYYLEPDKTGLKPYVLLRDALEKADRMALVTVSVRSRMTLAVLRVRDGVIVLQTLLWADEVRAPEFESLAEETHATSKELAMASSLVDSLSGDYVPDEFEDDYSGAVEALVASKIEGGDLTAAPEVETDETEVIDLLAALQRSVDKAKAARGGASSSSGPPAATTTAKKTATKTATETKATTDAAGATTAAKKTAAKRSTAKKAAAKKASGRVAADHPCGRHPVTGAAPGHRVTDNGAMT